MVEYRQSEEKKRSLSGNVGLGFFALSFVLVFVAFCTSSWLVSDRRITGANLDRFGLWTHCFRSLKDPHYQSDRRYERFFVGCRWIHDPFTTGYDEIHGFLLPGFMIATQLFYTLCFIAALLCAILSLLYFLCFGPEQDHFLTLITLNAGISLVGGICGCIAVIVFAALGNRNSWMPGHDNNFFGYSFVLACVGAVAMIIASILFFTDLYVQKRKKNQLQDSQAKFQIEYKS